MSAKKTVKKPTLYIFYRGVGDELEIVAVMSNKSLAFDYKEANPDYKMYRFDTSDMIKAPATTKQAVDEAA